MLLLVLILGLLRVEGLIDAVECASDAQRAQRRRADVLYIYIYIYIYMYTHITCISCVIYIYICYV